ncbi:integrase core domain-containing protein [Verrucomicrobiales bacterium]|nr:transposase [uncultured bacterium]MDC0322686.1 integrase core domain-containing protein [Verrucomicrobiales bacterium]
MDFKGDFALSRGGRCHPLTALDDFSRFNIILTAWDNERTETVANCLERAFSSYGLPDTILCDNGSPWGCASRWQDNDAAGYTTLEVWLMARGVGVIHGRPYHPQTQGKEERFHRTLKADVISRKMVWCGIADCGERFAPWRDKYNHKHPHESLDGQVPASRYRVSNRCYEGAVDEREFYREGENARVVRAKGEIHFRSRTLYIGTAFRGKSVAIWEAGDGITDLYFGAFRIGQIDWQNGIEGKPRGHNERVKSVRREEANPVCS